MYVVLVGLSHQFMIFSIDAWSLLCIVWLQLDLEYSD